MRIQRVAITILLVTVIILGGLTVNWDNQGISTQTAGLAEFTNLIKALLACSRY
jgi:hypothetical protein